MLYNTNLSFALKNEMGEYEVKDFILFQLDKFNSSFKNLKVNYDKNNGITFKLRCPFCNEYHYYTYKFNTFFKSDMIIGGCENLGEQSFIIGKSDKVIERVKRYMSIKSRIYAML